MGSLYTQHWKRADGTIYESPVLWIKYRQGGRTKGESTGTTKETVARRMLRLREGDVEHGIPICPRKDRILFEEAAQDLVNDYRASGKKSLKVLERRIRKHLSPFFGGKRLATLTGADIAALVAKRQKDVGVVTKARTITRGGAGGGDSGDAAPRLPCRDQSGTDDAEADAQSRD